MSDLIREDALVNCICLERTVFSSKERFLSEMNKNCPVHGFRRLGLITFVRIVPTRKDHTEKPDVQWLGLEEAVEEYERRLAEVEQAEDEKEYGWEEH